MRDNTAARIRSYVDRVASLEKPSRQTTQSDGLASFLTSFDAPRRSRVLIVHGRDADDHVSTALRAWCEKKEAVLPLRTSRMFGVEHLDFHNAIMRLACPFTELSLHLSSPRPQDDGLRWEPRREKGHQAESRRLVGMLSDYGGEHLRARSGRLDVEAYAIELHRSARNTLEAPLAFMRLVDELSVATEKELKSGPPVFVVHLDGLDACGFRVFDMLRRAARVLAHERVVFLGSYLGGCGTSIRDADLDVISCDDE